MDFPPEKKILLMGRVYSGKTSMKSIVFDNYPRSDTWDFASTLYINKSTVLFRNDAVLNIWDCGGDEEFSKSYFVTESDRVFGNVHVLVYVFNVNNHKCYEELKQDFVHFQECINSTFEYSPSAHVFCLIHKMDLLYDNDLFTRDDIFMQYKEYITEISKSVDCIIYKSSIWDGTLYQAWSEIMLKLVPNIRELDTYLLSVSENLDYDNALMLDSSTFLIVASFERKNLRVKSKFQQILNSCTKFKEKIRNSGSNLTCAEWIENNQSPSPYPVIIRGFDSKTYIAIAMPDLKTMRERQISLSTQIDCSQFFNTILNQSDVVSSTES